MRSVTSRAVGRHPTGGDPTDAVAVEEPLEIRFDDGPGWITMRSPGADRELAAGLLLTEGIVDGADDIVAIDHLRPGGGDAGNTVVVRLAGGVEAHRDQLRRLARESYANSACGVCGRASIEHLARVAPPLGPPPDVSADLLLELPRRLLDAQAAFHRTGGLHAAALVAFDGTLEVVYEDVGRHNAVDKVLGHRLLADRVPVDDRILVVSSRAGFEIVQKALVARIPVVAAIGAATSLAIDLARAGGIRLVAFLRDDRFNDYGVASAGDDSPLREPRTPRNAS